MIRQAVALMAILIVAVPAQAETIVARSGEHDGFTRLVMRLPENANWSLSQAGKSATLQIDDPAAVFDTSQVFSRIPRTRVQSLQQSGTGNPLRIQLGCNCEIKSYVQKDGYLVIDVRDGKDEKPYTSTSGVLPLGTLPGGSEYRFNLSPQQVQKARMGLDLAAAFAGRTASAGNALQTALPQQVENPEPEAQPAVVLPVAGVNLSQTEDQNLSELVLPTVDLLLDMDETARAAAVNASEQRLLQQIGRATNQGLLDLVMTEVGEGSAPMMVSPLTTQDRPMNPLDHLAVTTAVDREMGLMPQQTQNNMAPNLCINPRELAVYNWGGEESFADQIGPLRSALFKEFDHVDLDNVLSLAKTYLYFGFGAEARTMLDMLPPGDTRVDKLSAMAVLLDGGHLPITHPFAGQQACDGDAAFWAALADGALKNNANAEAIQQTLARMPVHLRVHLGPEISTLFAKSGDQHMASASLRSVNRTGVEEVPDINLAQAAIADMAGDTDTVAEELKEELAERTENAPQALIDLIALSYKERKALSPDLPELVASYELEIRDSELGSDLRLAEVMALSLTGNFTEAFVALGQLSERDGPVAYATAVEPVLTLLTERADDVTFLQYGLIFAEEASATEAVPVADIMTRRLLDLGFSQQAQSMLMKMALEPKDETRRLMMAEAALGMDLPHRALVELMGLDGPEANKLRAQALWRNGEFGRAGEYFLAEEEVDAAARGFWHSEDLEAITSDEGGQFSQVAEVTAQLDEQAQEPEDMPPLAHARALVESSVGTRNRIEALLQGVTPMETDSE
ncbi:hypothetical protein [Parasedimentitalea marina]|uniref:hypothetical protein n=1 Tax=Parasedimentitalea marina TaxID=2483033 RepID=UPI0015A94C44|nr:hypothetical protein [Parasedimentitalea marina]